MRCCCCCCCCFSLFGTRLSPPGMWGCLNEFSGGKEKGLAATSPTPSPTPLWSSAHNEEWILFSEVLKGPLLCGTGNRIESTPLRILVPAVNSALIVVLFSEGSVFRFRHWHSGFQVSSLALLLTCPSSRPSY